MPKTEGQGSLLSETEFVADRICQNVVCRLRSKCLIGQLVHEFIRTGTSQGRSKTIDWRFGENNSDVVVTWKVYSYQIWLRWVKNEQTGSIENLFWPFHTIIYFRLAISMYNVIERLLARSILPLVNSLRYYLNFFGWNFDRFFELKLFSLDWKIYL